MLGHSPPIGKGIHQGEATSAFVIRDGVPHDGRIRVGVGNLHTEAPAILARGERDPGAATIGVECVLNGIGEKLGSEQFCDIGDVLRAPVLKGLRESTTQFAGRSPVSTGGGDDHGSICRRLRR
jgi:hypothetical protein